MGARFVRAVSLGGTLLCAALAASCTDPVLDDAIYLLGEEPGFYFDVEGKRVGTGETAFHRQGQPCVTCHQKSGSVPSVPFLVAGTVFETKAERRAAEDVQILLVDAYGESPLVIPRTNKAGNFFVTMDDWPSFRAFPIKVNIYRPDRGKVAMITHISREPSCAGCHRDPDRRVRNDNLAALGRVYLREE